MRAKPYHMGRHVISLTISLILALIPSLLFAQGTITALRMPTSFASGGGTGTTGYPYAVYVQITGFTAAANSQAWVKLYLSTNIEYMWSATSTWSNGSTYSDANQPKLNIDGSGNGSGWIYAKHNDLVTPTFALRARWVNGTSSNQITSSSYNVNALDMTSLGNGGWIVRTSSPAVNKAILAYAGGQIVGSYRTEDNGITEGYSYGSGGFKIAVPVGIIDSLVSINDNNSVDQVFHGPWSIQAGQETDATSGASDIGKGSAAIQPYLIAGTLSQTVTVKLYGQSSDTISITRIAVPSLWSWSHTTADLTVTGAGTPTDSVSGDTIIVSGLSLLGGDSASIAIANITPPDSTDLFQFIVATGSVPDSVFPIATQPRALVHGLPRAIADIKTNDVNGVPLLQGKYVTIRGVATVTSQFGGPGYMQDNSAGIAFYDSSVTNHINIGDEIVLIGTISPFNGLCELGSPILLETVSTGNTVDPLIVTVSQLKNDGAGGVENYEGLLVRVNTATVRDTFNNPIPNWTVGGSGSNYRLIDATAYMDIRVDNNVDYANLPAPQSAFDVIGVVSQFKSTSPYIGGYQLMPRFHQDILASGPLFATLPVESNLTQSSFTVSWRTVNNGSTGLRYGATTAYELGTLTPAVLDSLNHSADVTGLQAATIYHVLAFSAKGTDTSFAGDLVVSTSSPSASTGQINVYFNKSVNTTVATGELALGNQDLVSKILARIDNARYSIDAALYSLSGSSQGDIIANHLVSARGRGVHVRVICEHDNRSYSGFVILSMNGVPLIDDAYDPVWAGAGLMHNKFMVFDERGGVPESVWVWGGSWNPTFEGTTSDRQNSIEIQDVALAGAYTTEFNVMWGSSTDTPNQSASRFGARKPDVAPHNFMVKNVPISVYFSPSDHTTSKIGATLGRAQHSVANSILTFTRKDLADTLIGRKNAGSKVRVVMDNNTDQGNQYSYLQSNGIDVHLKGGSGLLHHKYAVVDADQGAGDQYLITGSHNWSNSAENSNDENTLIIKSGRLPNLYLQEFAARYYEAGGTDSIRVIMQPQYSASPLSINFDTVTVAAAKPDSFSISNTGSALLSITGVSSTDGRFGVVPASASIAAGASQTFTVTFSPDAAGPMAGFIVLTHNAAGSPDSIALHGVGRVLDTTSTTTVAVGHALGWNMISLPLSVTDPRKVVLYPSAISPAFAYQDTYVTKDSLVPGTGYWLKFDAAKADSITGLPILRDTIILAASWNMIGGITSAVAVNGIIQSPPGNVVSPYFGFSGGYQEIDTLRPGKSCWVKASQAGYLVLTGAAIVPKTAPQQGLKGLNTVTFADGAGNQQTLYFGVAAPAPGAGISYDLPPVPPAEAFDVRFGSGKMAETLAEGVQKAVTTPIRVQSAAPALSVRWSIDTHDRNSYTLEDGSGATLRLAGTGSAPLRVGPRGLSLTLLPGRELPKVFALGQNYPNPFNPVTMIPIALPQAANVTLTIVNTLGEVVKRVLDHQDMEEGYHNVAVDGSSMASGVYFYKLDVPGAFSQVKKFILIK